MARVTLDLPQKFLFTTEMPIRATDLNYGGHVGNDKILTLVQDARVTFYRSLGFKNELNFEGDIGQIIADAVVVYKSESFLGDVLVFQLGIAEFNKYGFDMICLITNKSTGKEVARVKTGILCFDYAKKKVASVPDVLLKKLQ
jgi:acyl-CoA thioester hydrolase